MTQGKLRHFFQVLPSGIAHSIEIASKAVARAGPQVAKAFCTASAAECVGLAMLQAAITPPMETRSSS